MTTYDRSDLITRAIATLTHELTIEMIIVSLVILLFLWHIPSALVPILTIPLSVLLAFIPMYYLGVTVNIMSLAGIAISIGVLVDGAIVEVENAYNRLHRWQAEGRVGDFHAVRLEALQGSRAVGVLLAARRSRWRSCPSSRWSIRRAVSSSRWRTRRTWPWPSRPLLAITLDPAVRMLFTRMDPFTFRPRALSWLATKLARRDVPRRGAAPDQPLFFAVYEPVCRLVLRFPKTVIAVAIALVAVSVPVYFTLGSEFMPPAQRGHHPLHADDAARHLGRSRRGSCWRRRTAC